MMWQISGRFNVLQYQIPRDFDVTDSVVGISGKKFQETGSIEITSWQDRPRATTRPKKNAICTLQRRVTRMRQLFNSFMAIMLPYTVDFQGLLFSKGYMTQGFLQ